jgi:hypothetical protein
MRFPCLSAPPAPGSARHDGFQSVAAFRPKVFATSRRFPPRSALRASFIPLARLGFPLQGFSPFREPFLLSEVVALWSLLSSLLFLAKAKKRELGFRALLPLKVRGSPACCYACRGSVPSWGSSSPGYSVFRSWFALQRPSPLVLRQELVQDAFLLAPQGLSEPKT